MNASLQPFFNWLSLQTNLALWISDRAVGFANAHWPFGFVIPAIALTYASWRSYRLWEQAWLSGLVDRRLRETRSKKRRAWLTSFKIPRWKTLFWTFRSSSFRSLKAVQAYLGTTPQDVLHFYFPSAASFFLVLILFAVVFFAPQVGDISSHIPSGFFTALDDSEPVKKIFEGLIVIAVALIIFVSESIREIKNPERKRVLLRISNLWPLTLAVTLFPLGYLAGDITPAVVLLLMLMSAFAIYSFSKILRNLLDPDAQERNLRVLLKDRIHSLIMDSVRERVANNILLQTIGAEHAIDIEYSVWRSNIDRSAYKFVDHPKDGWISDINLNELHALIVLLRSQDFKKAGIPATEASLDEAAVRDASATDLPVKKIYLLTKFGDQLTQDSPFNEGGRAVLAIPTDILMDDRLAEDVQRRVAQIFRLTKSDPSSKAFQRELRGTKDQFVSAIRSISLGAIDDLRQTYLEVAEEFLVTLNDLGGGYSSEQALNERGNITGSWNEVRWLSGDVRELLIVATATDNVDVIGDIAYLPFAIATRAVAAGDHLLFQEFTPFASFIYSLGVSKKEEGVRRFMVDRSWRYLRDICEYYVLPFNLERGGKPTDLISAEGFALQAFKIFQDILKLTFDNNDLTTFQVVLVETTKLFKNFSSRTQHPSSAFLKALRKRTEDDDEKSHLASQIDQQEKKEGALDRILIGRQQMLFGLAAYILDKRVLEDGAEKNRSFYAAIEPLLPKDIIGLTKLFEYATNLASSDFFDWTRWDTIADGEARFVDTTTKPDRLYSLLLLKILAKLSDQETSQIKILPSEAVRGLLFRVNEQGVPNALDAATLSQDRQDTILSAEELNKTPALAQVLSRIKDAADRVEEDGLIASVLDADKLKAFIEKVLSTRTDQARLRPLMQKLNAYVPDLAERGARKIPSWGFNQLDDKGAFVANYRVSYPAWGEHYGRSLAQAEDKFGFIKMVESSGRHLSADQNYFIETIATAIKLAGLKSPIVAHSLLSHLELFEMKMSDHFISRYQSDCPSTSVSKLAGFSGVLKLEATIVPVITLFVPEAETKGKILVADFEQFARWHQYPPVDESDDEAHVRDGVFIRVKDLNVETDTRSKILQDNPAYLSNKPDKDRYLRTRVVVNVFERFEVEILDTSAAVTITVQLDQR